MRLVVKIFIRVWLVIGGLIPLMAVAQTPAIEVLTPNVCIPQTVKLRVKNCTGCTNYEWKIGSGNFQSGSSDYATVMTSPGTFDVEVRVTTSGGVVVPLQKLKAFRVHDNPVIDVGFSKVSLCGNATDTITITDNSKNVVYRDWLIESRFIGNGPKEFRHVFTQGGKGYKRVYITVKDSWGCQSQKVMDSTIGIWDDVVFSATPSRSGGCAPLTVRFTPTIDSANQSVGYIKWWVPGSTADSLTGRNPLVTYNKAGVYSYKAMLVTKAGCKYFYENLEAMRYGDTAVMSISYSPSTLCANRLFTATVSNTGTGNVSWNINGAGYSGQTSGSSVKGKFNDTGSADITVTSESGGCRSYLYRKKAALISGPKASFTTPVPFYCATPDTVQFTNTSVLGPSTTWRWTLWDSSGSIVNVATGKDFQYITNSINKYSARLIASSSNGCIDTIYQKNIVVGGSIDTEFVYNPAPTCPFQKVTFSSRLGPGTPRTKNKFAWTFYNLSGGVLTTSTDEQPVIQYSLPGNYAVRMIVSNNRGCRDTQTKNAWVKVEVPDVILNTPDSIVCTNQKFLLKATQLQSVKGFTSSWKAFHQDSVNIIYQSFGDSALMQIGFPGIYRIEYTIEKPNGECKFTIKHNRRIKVSGAILKTSISPTYGCAPLPVTLNANLLKDLNYHGNSSAFQYLWKRTNPAGFPITDPTQPVINSTLARGEYECWLVYKTGSGCVDSVRKTYIESGIRSRINIPYMGRCRGNTVNFGNASSWWADSVRWVCDSPSVIIKPSRTVWSPNGTFTQMGDFPLKLIVKYQNCSDTSSTVINIFKLKASLYSPDSVVYCAPKLVKIFNTTPGAINSWWTFSNGATQYSKNNDLITQSFKENLGSGYDVKLVVQNYLGCYDTLEKKSFFKVIGPIPRLTVSGNKGCEPLTVAFNNNSQDYAKAYIDYGDGTVTDSLKNGQFHTYRVTDKSLTTQGFNPKLIVADKFNCFAYANASDSVEVFKTAEPNFSYTSARFLRKTEGCAGELIVSFSDKSRFVSKNYWDFDNDGKIDIRNQPAPNYLFGKPGVFKTKLIAENINGCKDSITIDSFVVWEKPVPTFKPSKDSFCAKDAVQFTFDGSSAWPIVAYRWDFGDPTTFKDTSSQKNPAWRYKNPFNHAVSLNVRDVKGCTATVTRGVYVLDTAGPKPAEIAFITVKDPNTVQLNWHKSGLGNFMRYHIYLDSTRYIYRKSVSSRQDTTLLFSFSPQTLSNQRYCYSLKVEDTCAQQGKLAVSHCSILLRDTSTQKYHIDLKWLSYDGWGNELSHYELFRKEPGGSFKSLAIIDKDQLLYTDSWKCDQTYCYVVEAVHKNKVYRSRSNETCGKPLYGKPDGSALVTLVTVANDSFPSVFWKSDYAYNPGATYVLEKSGSGLPGTFQPVKQVQGLSAVDNTADAHTAAYFYRVLFKDHCGLTGDAGAPSNSIHLKSVPGSKLIRINWNQYGYWHAGVREYKLQLKQRNGSYTDWLKLSPSQTGKDSINLESFGLDSICFRVVAIKDTLTLDSSISNSVCFVPSSYIWVPSGFSPNQNGLNEVFKPTLGYVFGNHPNLALRYEFRIFNRWGQMIFSTNNPSAGWDGRFMESDCPVGLYIYEVKAVGYDGIPHQKKGTVYLIR